MKKLLLAVLAVATVTGSFAAAKKPGFAAYEAGEWKPLDNRKGHIYGPQLFEGDLHLQPVIVVKFDPAMLVEADTRTEDTRFMNLRGTEGEDLPKRFAIINVPTRPLTKDELANLPNNGRKMACAWGHPWYADAGLVKEPENPAKEYPFYYVVSAENKVVYAGGQGATAQNTMERECRKQTKRHSILGELTPTVHEALCAKLAFGEDTSAVAKKLTPIAAAKADSDAKTEATSILWLIDQSKSYWRRVISETSSANPPLAVIYATMATKTFKGRDSKVFQEALTRLNALPQIKQIVKTYQPLFACKQKIPEKKSDIDKAYSLACQAEKMCQKAQKTYGEKLPRAFLKLEDLVLQVKAELEAAGAEQKK